MPNTVLVTGGAGFIGSHLCEKLVNRGYLVISLDNYSTGSKDNHVAGVEYREGDTRNIADLVPESPTLIFHLGEYARVEQSYDNIETILDSNVEGTKAVLEFVRQKGSKLVYAGSSTKHTARDGSPYAYTKATNTEEVVRYGERYDITYAITYFYNVYGPRERSDLATGTVIGIFAENQKRGQKLSVRAPGTQKRHFTHVEDIVDGLVLVGEKGYGDGYDLGADKAYSILEVAHLFGGDIEMIEARAGDRDSHGITDSRAREELGWETHHELPAYISAVRK